MTTINHPNYSHELERLNYTLSYLKNYHDALLSKKFNIDKAIDFDTKHFNSDNSQQYIDLIINSTLQDNLSQRLKNLEKARLKPYFARVDFTEEGTNSKEKLYIGKTSLLREEDNKFLIVDWRAPISNLYYEGRLGASSYSCPEGDVKGEIHLKRQLTIENGELENLFDVDITTNDDFLQACLGANADNRLKDIVSTIQGEQNKVIRADMWKPLIVQGAAGGGKTTIALHRIAYLLYTYEKNFSPQNFMIIAPNRFFLSYISEVLPELGVENVKQSTFEDFACDIVSKKFKLTDSFEKLASFVNRGSVSINEKNNLHYIKKISQFKSSLQFKDVVEFYMKTIEENFLPKEDFKIGSYVVFKYEELQSLFLEEYKNLPMMKRLNEIKKHLRNNLKRQKESLLTSVENHYDRKIQNTRDHMKDCPERREIIIELTGKRDTLLDQIKKCSQSLLSEYMNKIRPSTPDEYYKELLTNNSTLYSLLENYLNSKEIQYLIGYSKELFQNKQAEIEDLAPLMYIKYLVFGLDQKIAVRHIIIDEAQDFSLFQLFVLKTIVKDSSFTILGDLCQGIHSYRGITNWQDVSEYIFKEKDASLLNLEQSYRTTIEIMNAASSVIKHLKNNNLPAAKPVIRHGMPVKVIQKNSFEEIAWSIKEKIDNLNNEGFKSAAIICKTLEECMELKKLLKTCKVNPKVITGKEKEFSGGVVIVPSYLVKGLEFDLVIVANASSQMYLEEELDIKLLYVAMTRPLHKLYIYSCGEPCTMLKGI